MGCKLIWNWWWIYFLLMHVTWLPVYLWPPMSYAIPSLPSPIGNPPPHGPHCLARSFAIGKPPKPFDDSRNDLSSNGLLHSQDLQLWELVITLNLVITCICVLFMMIGDRFKTQVDCKNNGLMQYIKFNLACFFLQSQSKGLPVLLLLLLGQKGKALNQLEKGDN